MDRIEQGNLYKVVTDEFKTSYKDKRGGRKKSIMLKKGEIIEIRYPYEWHFRTIDNEYYHATPEMIEENCEYAGKIWSKVQFGNNCNLYEILRLRLYDPIKTCHKVITEEQLEEFYKMKGIK